MLADFGLSRLMVVDEKSRTKWRENLGDYIAPECIDDAFNPQEVGRSTSIWGFGGIIIDIAWYLEQGMHGMQKARLARQGPKDKNKWDNRCFFLKSELKPNVMFLSNELRDQARDAAVPSLLRLGISMRRISPQLRPSAEDFRRNMTFVTVKSP